MPVRMLIKVVFPAPLWPRTAISSFGYIQIVSSFKAFSSSLKHMVLKVLLRDFILRPKAGILFQEFWQTLFLYLIADSSTTKLLFFMPTHCFFYFLQPKSFIKFLIGKKMDQLLPLLVEMTWSQYQARTANRRASPYSMNIESKSEYLSNLPPPKGNLPEVEEVKTFIS